MDGCGAAQPKWLRTATRRYRRYSNPNPLERTHNWMLADCSGLLFAPQISDLHTPPLHPHPVPVDTLCDFHNTEREHSKSALPRGWIHHEPAIRATARSWGMGPPNAQSSSSAVCATGASCRSDLHHTADIARADPPSVATLRALSSDEIAGCIRL